MICVICGAPGRTVHFVGERTKLWGLCSADPRCYWVAVMRDSRARAERGEM